MYDRLKVGGEVTQESRLTGDRVPRQLFFLLDDARGDLADIVKV
jgi:hypothetical protein